MALLAGCSREPVPLASYEWVDESLEQAPFPLFPGSKLIVGQTDLLRRARALNQPDEGEPRWRVVLYETDASLAEVEAFFVVALGSTSDAPPSPRRLDGDFAADERALAPILEKLHQPHDPGVGRGSYRSVVIPGGPGRPTVSLQRPYRDFVHDRIVDRTSILISD